MTALTASIQTTGALVLRYGLVLVILWIGALKFTAAEAAAIQPLVSNSPVLGWTYGFLSAQAFFSVLGVVEIVIGLLISFGPASPRAGAAGMFEPALGGFPAPSAGGAFILKDVVLLGGALSLLGAALEDLR